MKKHLLSILIILLSSSSLLAQVKFGDNRSTIQPGSLMELESTNKGLLNVRMNTAQMLSIPVSPTSNGLMIYNTDSSCLCLYNGTSWKNLCANTSSPGSGTRTKMEKIIYTAKDGDYLFDCPEIVYDDNFVQVFRNGVQINFTATIGTTKIKLELAAYCKKDDEIKIVQLVNY